MARSRSRSSSRGTGSRTQGFPASPRAASVTTLTDILSLCIYSRREVSGGDVVTSTVVLNGQLITEGVKFLWWVTDGRPARITVSHPLHGTKTQLAERNPERQAKVLARMLLAAESPSDELPAA